MPKVSIIVPVYNTEKYLEKCLESLVNQTLSDIEVLVINDGSPDNSEQIIKKYEEKYPEIIKYFSKPNGGLSDARNFGIEKATAEYIGFVDSDDYIELDMYENLYNKAIEGDFDVTVCNLYMVYEDNDKRDVISSSINNDIRNKGSLKELMTYVYPTAWNKIYKKELLQNIKFKKNIWFEDVEFMLRLFPSINSIGVVNKPLYNYLQRENSITYTFNKKLYNFIDNMEGVIEYYKENNLYDEYKEEIEYLYVRYAFATFMKRLAKAKDKKIYKEGYRYAITKVKENFPEYRKNKYLKQNGLKGYYIKYFNKMFANLNYILQKNKKYN